MTTNSHRRTGSQAGNIALWVLQMLAAALFVYSSYWKLFSDPMTVAGFEAMGFGQWLRYFVGVAELAGGIGLLVPALCGLAGSGLVALMIGATVITITQAQGQIVLVAFPAVTLLVVAIIAWGRRESTARLLRRLTGRAERDHARQVALAE
ncbi:DoxX family protein [Saccharopolyspora sp. 5N102]|uniref:DoxX family protein n=1 Tax=Saccharopolyspora sp. 5N102 TaxID=3375155 RepID=UPI003796ECE8